MVSMIRHSSESDIKKKTVSELLRITLSENHISLAKGIVKLDDNIYKIKSIICQIKVLLQINQNTHFHLILFSGKISGNF